MDNQINLFSYLSREMSSDAFLMWLFNFINQDKQLRPVRDAFFDTLILKAEDTGKKVTDLHARRRDKKWERDSDIVLDFRLDGEKKTLLFETRISPLTSLRGYKSIYPHLYTCVYLKKGKVSHQERKLAEKHGYLVKDMDVLMAALQPMTSYSTIIQHYFQYLEETYKEVAQENHPLKSNTDDDFYRLRSRYLKFT